MLATACGESPELTQERQRADSLNARLNAANQELAQLKAANAANAEPVEPPPPPPPPKPAMPEWQVVRYAPSGTVTKVFPVFRWDISNNCVWFMQTEKQASYSMACGGQFDIVLYEPK
jgi:hypothetical protein